MTDAATALVLAAAIGTASFIITRAEISKAPRLWLAKRTSATGIWFYKLVSCPLCTGTWLSLFATGIYRPWLVHLWQPLDFVVTALAITSVAMLAVAVIQKAVHP